MANEAIRTEIRGLKDIQKRMDQAVKDIGGSPVLDWMRKATLLVQRDAKKLAPVDTGRLRASITPEVRTAFHTIEGVVGSNVVYAPYQEFGTKYMPGRFYLRDALQQNADRIFKLLGDTVAQIVTRANR